MGPAPSPARQAPSCHTGGLRQAKFTGPETLEVDGEPVVGAAYVVATGAAPHIPDLPSLNGVEHLTSTTAMEQQDLPASMIVMGGGYVGLEQAQLWAHLGVQVTLVGRFAPHAEPEIADVLRGVFADDGIHVVEGARRSGRPRPGVACWCARPAASS